MNEEAAWCLLKSIEALIDAKLYEPIGNYKDTPRVESARTVLLNALQEFIPNLERRSVI